MKLYVHMREPKVTVLGPGTRYVVWTAGCNRNCPGCIAPASHDMHKGDALSVGALAWEILLSGAEGLTISGGEPFLQPQALAELIRLIRKKKDMGVILYTGFRIEELQEMPEAQELLEQVDLLIDGPYIREQDDGGSLRGSRNQRVLDLTGRYRDSLHLYGVHGRKTQRFYHAGAVHYIGLPRNSQYEENDT